MSESNNDWIFVERPSAATRVEALKYFGVPPSSETELATNINTKRRRWHSRSNGPGGAEIAKLVKDIVRQLEDYLLKGGSFPEGVVAGSQAQQQSRQLPPPNFSSIEQLLELVEALTSRGQYQRAIETAREGLNKWPESTEVAILFSFAVASAAGTEFQVSNADLNEAIRTSQIVTQNEPTNVTAWWTLSTLLAASGRHEEILLLEAEIVRKLGGIPVPTLLVIARALIRTPDMWRGLEMALRAVESDPADAGIRLESATIAIEAARKFLPIDSAEKVTDFRKAVSAAAWCAHGVASVEVLVRPFRMWAERCDDKMFTGSHRFRSFVSIITLFIWLPIHNAQANKRLWEIVLNGPSDGQLEFYALSEMKYIQDVHSGIKFMWLENRVSWPQKPIGVDLN